MSWDAVRKRRSADRRTRSRFAWVAATAVLAVGLVAGASALRGSAPAAATAPNPTTSDPLVEQSTTRLAGLEQALDQLGVEVTQARLDKDARRADCLLEKHQRLGEVLLAGRGQIDELARATANGQTVARLHAADRLRKLADDSIVLQAAARGCTTPQLAAAN